MEPGGCKSAKKIKVELDQILYIYFSYQYGGSEHVWLGTSCFIMLIKENWNWGEHVGD
jgi:hypothetical protein